MDDANVHAHVVDGFDYADSTEIDEELVTLENQPMWTDTPPIQPPANDLIL